MDAVTGEKHMDTALDGKVAVITGAGRIGGIGQAIACALARERAKIVLSDIGQRFERFPEYEVAERSEIERFRKTLTDSGAEAEIVSADVSKEKDVESLVQAAVDRFGRLDVMVDNAGIGLGLVPITELTVDAWRQNLDVMALGTMLGIREAAKHMIRQGEGGAIVLFLASKQGRYITGSAINTSGGQEMH